MLLNLLDERQLKHRHTYIYIHIQITGTILKVHDSVINRYIVKYQKIKHVFKSTSVRSGRGFLVEFTKMVLGHMLQAGSLTVIQTLNNANSLEYLLWLK